MRRRLTARSFTLGFHIGLASPSGLLSICEIIDTLLGAFSRPKNILSSIFHLLRSGHRVRTKIIEITSTINICCNLNDQPAMQIIQPLGMYVRPRSNATRVQPRSPLWGKGTYYR